MSIKIKHRKPYLVKEIGDWKFTFHYKEGNIAKTFLSITSKSGIFNCRIGGNTDTYGYLLAAAIQGRDDQLRGYAMTVYIPTMTITLEKELNEDIQKAIVRFLKRRNNEAAKKAAEITDSQETVNQSIMEDVAEFSDAKSDEERKAIREKWKEDVAQALDEIADKTDDKE